MGDQALRIEVRPVAGGDVSRPVAREARSDDRATPPAEPEEPPRVAVRARPTAVHGCTYCHGEIGEREEVALCPRCQTTLHAACRHGIDRCPTLGCDGIADRPADRLLRSPEAELERGGFLELGALAIGPLLGALLMPVLLLGSLGGPELESPWELLSPLAFLAIVGAMLGSLLGAALGLAVDLVGLRSRPARGARLLVPLLVVALAAAGAAVGVTLATSLLLAGLWGSLGLVAGLRLFGSPLR